MTGSRAQAAAELLSTLLLEHSEATAWPATPDGELLAGFFFSLSGSRFLAAVEQLPGIDTAALPQVELR